MFARLRQSASYFVEVYADQTVIAFAALPGDHHRLDVGHAGMQRGGDHVLGRSEIRSRPWSLVVFHDLPTGAMRHPPLLLDGLDALGAEIVQDFPDACVPIRNGGPTR
jgi:hypothetical protein